MKYLGSNMFLPSTGDKTKTIIVAIFYLLCFIPYLFLLTGQPFRCLAFSLFISWFGCFVLLFARWQKKNTIRIKWAIYISLLPGLICFILAPAFLMQRFFQLLPD